MDLFGTRAITQRRKILIPLHIPRLIKYLKVKEYIREIVQESERAFLLVEGDRFFFNNISFHNENKFLRNDCPLLKIPQVKSDLKNTWHTQLWSLWNFYFFIITYYFMKHINKYYSNWMNCVNEYQKTDRDVISHVERLDLTCRLKNAGQRIQSDLIGSD